MDRTWISSLRAAMSWSSYAARNSSISRSGKGWHSPSRVGEGDGEGAATGSRPGAPHALTSKMTRAVRPGALIGDETVSIHLRFCDHDGMQGRAMSRRRFLTLLAGAFASIALPWRSALAARKVTMICRRAWGARPPSGEFHRHRIRRLTVHHSAVVLRENRKAPERFRDHQAAHQARGWPDIAYHILIDRNGHVYEGRPLWARGDTSTDYRPRGHLLVLCEGNFDRQRLSREQAASLADVLAWAVRRFDVPVAR